MEYLEGSRDADSERKLLKKRRIAIGGDLRKIFGAGLIYTVQA